MCSGLPPVNSITLQTCVEGSQTTMSKGNSLAVPPDRRFMHTGLFVCKATQDNAHRVSGAIHQTPPCCLYWLSGCTDCQHKDSPWGRMTCAQKEKNLSDRGKIQEWCIHNHPNYSPQFILVECCSCCSPKTSIMCHSSFFPNYRPVFATTKHVSMACLRWLAWNLTSTFNRPSQVL